MKRSKNFSQAKNVKFLWAAPMHSTEVTIKIPEFSEAEHETKGDWGPMYKVDVSPTSPLEISYVDSGSRAVDGYFLEQRSFALNSPMLAELRKKTPLFFEIQDERKELLFHLYMGNDGEVVRVEVLRSEDKVKLYEGKPC